MNDQLGDILLEEMRGMRKDINKGFSDLSQRVTAIETNTEPFFETDGGRDKIKEDLEDLKKAKWLVLGGAGVVATVANYMARKLGF